MGVKNEGRPGGEAEYYSLVNEPPDIPSFVSLAEEHEFWRTHRFSSHFWRNHSGNVPRELRAPRDLSRLPAEEQAALGIDITHANPHAASSNRSKRRRAAPSGAAPGGDAGPQRGSRP